MTVGQLARAIICPMGRRLRPLDPPTLGVEAPAVLIEDGIRSLPTSRTEAWRLVAR